METLDANASQVLWVAQGRAMQGIPLAQYTRNYVDITRVVLGNADCKSDTRRSHPEHRHFGSVAERGNMARACFRDFIVFNNEPSR